MKYQLVLQLPGLTREDFDDLVALEDSLMESLGSDHRVDGHDFGSGTMNVFVLTNDPTAAFLRAREAICPSELLKLKAAYREVSGDEYVVLWPEGSTDPFQLL